MDSLAKGRFLNAGKAARGSISGPFRGFGSGSIFCTCGASGGSLVEDHEGKRVYALDFPLIVASRVPIFYDP
jgi:hypothetical protein